VARLKNIGTPGPNASRVEVPNDVFKNSRRLADMIFPPNTLAPAKYRPALTAFLNRRLIGDKNKTGCDF
jgi:hypothetical protein